MLEYIEKIIFIKITVDTEMALMAKREQNYILGGYMYRYTYVHTCIRTCTQPYMHAILP